MPAASIALTTLTISFAKPSAKPSFLPALPDFFVVAKVDIGVERAYVEYKSLDEQSCDSLSLKIRLRQIWRSDS